MDHALRVLEFDAVLERLVSQCETALGADAASCLKPVFQADQVWELLDLTSEAHDMLAKSPPPSLGHARDLRGTLKRAEKGGVLGGEELYRVAEAISAMRGMRSHLHPRQNEWKRLWHFGQFLPDLRLIETQLFDSLDGGGDVKDSASSELSRLRQKKLSASSKIVERIQSYTNKHRDLLSDPIYTTRDGRYVIPLKAENKGKIRGIVHDTSGSGQTVYVEPDDVVALGNELRQVEAAEREEISRILRMLSEKVGKVSPEVMLGLENAAHLDLALAKGKLAFDMRAMRPQKASGFCLIIEQCRHPLIDQAKVVPVTLSVGQSCDGLLITGPNTGGKTVAIKAAGLCVLMAQAGLFVPALDCRIAPFSQIWADIGDEQSLQQSLSTFSGHVKNIGEAIKGLKPGALVLLDEVGAGTDPAEGASLARAILVALQKGGAKVIASTHYGELKAFAYNTSGFINAAMEFDAKTLLPTYRLIVGAPGSSHALKIAERYGIPKAVIDEAKEGLSTEHLEVAKMLEQLEVSTRQARAAQSEADRLAARLKVAEQEAARKLAEADEVRKTAYERGSAKVEDTIRDIRLESQKLFDELKSLGGDKRAQESIRSELRALQELGEETIKSLRPAKKATNQVLRKGDTVKVDGYGTLGVLLEELNGTHAMVQMGALRISVPVDSLRLGDSKSSAPTKAKPNLSLQKAQTASSEIHLRAMRAEEAMQDLERFLDDAVLGGIPSVRIVHGKGTGVLRNLTRETLRKHPHVSRFRDGDATEGGHGVTIADLR